MAELHPIANEPLREPVIDETFSEVAEVLTTMHGMEQLEAFAAIAGGNDSYNALISASEKFIKANPGICEGRSPSPHIVGLWIGLVVGAGSARKV